MLDFGFHPTFSRHGKVEASFTLLIWLNENVLMLLCLKDWSLGSLVYITMG